MVFVWFIAILVGFFLIKFLVSLNKDNHDLEGQSLDEKFRVIVNQLNDVAYHGEGRVTRLDKRSFNLYKQGSNQIINFHYSTGHLTITWKYKYFQKEVVHERQFPDVRNLSIFEQQRIADAMIAETADKVERHKQDVIGGGV